MPNSPNGLSSHESKLLQALQLVVDSGKARTSEDLVKYSRQAKEEAAAGFLAELAADGLPVQLALDALSVHLRRAAFMRTRTLITDSQNRRTGLLLPLPPHVMGAFDGAEHLTFLVMDEHHVPHFLEHSKHPIIAGSRRVKEAAAKQEVLVFEAFQAKKDLLASADAADVLDARLLSPEVRFVVHLRPHQRPDDVPISLPADRIQIL